METPWALTQHAFEGAGHFFLETQAGAALLNLGLLAGVVYLGYKGLQWIGGKISGNRSQIHSLLSNEAGYKRAQGLN